MKTPFILAILDGWGINKPYNGNAITQAVTPVYDSLWKDYPHTELCAHGRCVGLPSSQDGNSEAGHMNLGAGRTIDQDTVIISKAINSGLFFKNTAFKQTIDHIKEYKSNVHLIGLLSGWQSAHSDPDHILALLTFYRQQKIKNVYIHLFTDGRDSFKYGAEDFLKKLQKQMQNGEKIATISGRYYAMDRKKKWDRTEKVYDALTLGKTDFYARSASEAIQQAYERGETDEFIIPTVMVEDAKCNAEGICNGGTPVVKIKNNDAVVFFNLRSDRTRELTKAFVQKAFNKKNPRSFSRKKILKNLLFVAMTDFGPDLDHVVSAFPSPDIKNTLPMLLSDVKQLYIAENEKYAHVTYFFNGGYADPVGNEDRIMIASPDVSGYDQKPEMSTPEVTNVVLENLKKNKYDFITINFANPDMVGHTGNLAAGIKACESVDKSLKKILNEIKNKKGVLIITADHGNVEEMIDEETGEVDTQHSNFKVPFILIDTRDGQNYSLKQNGSLGNVAPTILDLMHKKIPKEMDESLIIKN
ncbi:MAG: 2,3-bisphosphoglycerate-independent phosphoglycerate mutase [Patescibacteria group bacterium]